MISHVIVIARLCRNRLSSRVQQSMTSKRVASEKFSVAPRINWTVLCLGLVFLAILLRLGFWQLERADEKHQLLSHIEQQQSLPAVDLESTIHDLENTGGGLVEDLKYRQVTVRGQFDAERYWLLDNQVQQGVVGYHVIGLFVSERGLRMLVNRGWIAAPQYRERLPAVSFPAGVQTLNGRLVLPSDNPLMISAPAKDQTVDTWPKRIQKVVIAEAEQTLGQALLPALVQLTADDPAALLMEWRDINVSVSKHRGYAVQWFAMAAALVVALVFANTNLSKRIQEQNRES